MPIPKIGDTVRLAPFDHNSAHLANFWTWIEVKAVRETDNGVEVEGVYLNGLHLEGERRVFKLEELDLETI